MTSAEATARASANIAFVKYWGNVDTLLRLPYNDSVSMNLDAATTTTTVRFDDGAERDEVTVDGRALDGEGRERAVAHLDLVRGRVGIRTPAVVTSHNTFPMGTGIASSASGYAALTVAAAAAAVSARRTEDLETAQSGYAKFLRDDLIPTINGVP